MFFDSLIAEGKRIAEADECRSIRGLAVSGRDIMSAGLSGEEVGKALEELLELVITEALPNDREALMEHIRRKINA